MKNIRLIAITFILMFACILNVKAYGTSMKGTTSINPNGEVTVTVAVNGATNLWGTMGKLSFDSSKLTLVSSSGLNGFNITVGTNLVADAASGKSGNFDIATLKFKATSSFAVGQNSTISLGAQEGSDGSSMFSGTGSSIVINMTAPKSTNNNLKDLVVSNTSIKFNKSTTSYSTVVDYNVDKIEISASAQDSSASLSGTGTKTLSVYSNTFNVVVTAENGSKKTYRITVVRKDENGNTAKLSNDNTLSSLKVTNYDLNFDANKTDYTIEIANDVTDIEVLATASNGNATVKVNKPEEFVVGENIITVEVTSQTGETSTYTIKVIKQEAPVVPEEPSQDNNITEKSKENLYRNIAIGESLFMITGLITLLVLIKKRILVFRK